MTDTIAQPAPDIAVDDDVHDPIDDEENIFPIEYVTPEEGRRLFDEAAREMMGMSGEDFITRWEAGEYDDIFDKYGHRHIGMLAALIPLARQEP